MAELLPRVLEPQVLARKLHEPYAPNPELKALYREGPEPYAQSYVCAAAQRRCLRWM